MQRTKAPFRADEVGSLLRPPRIKEARARLEKGEITAADLRKAEDMEIDERELEADLQPAHRAEALEVLANIELKFALLRERVYVEKLDDLAWEEMLISDGSYPLVFYIYDQLTCISGTHPELLNLHAELTKRRDKRLELALRRRSYEMDNSLKRRRVGEDGVWTWWKVCYSPALTRFSLIRLRFI